MFSELLIEDTMIFFLFFPAFNRIALLVSDDDTRQI